MNEPWQGTFTALVTPFTADGAVDERSLARLVDLQIEGGVEGIVGCGTTGESATLSNEEQLGVIQIIKERADARLLIVAGVGGNSTDRVVAQARAANALGVDGILSVVPYYNKPTQEGLYRHFSELADAVDVPIILYNVPSRTGANLLPVTVRRLAKHENVRGIKEASGDLSQVMELLGERPKGFSVLSGEDNLAYPVLALGGDGVVSVVSNEVPMLMSRMVREALAGHHAEAREIHFQLLGLMNANFIESNPIPVKAALAMMGLIGEHYRLPMVPIRDENRARLRGQLALLDLVEKLTPDRG
ncbi:MAG: 4-hydroxy-tetrahydrodipicolinate synthase [Vicinamibacteria bacterium]